MTIMSLTQREADVLRLSYLCFSTEPKVDFAKLAQVANFNSSKTASNCYAMAKKKLLGGASSSAQAKSPASKKNDAGTGGEGDDNTESTPKQRARKSTSKVDENGDPLTPTPRAKRAKKDTQEDDDGVPSTPAKRAKKNTKGTPKKVANMAEVKIKTDEDADDAEIEEKLKEALNGVDGARVNYDIHFTPINAANASFTNGHVDGMGNEQVEALMKQEDADDGAESLYAASEGAVDNYFAEENEF